MPRVRLPSGELRDEIRQPLYDTIDIAAAENPQGPVRSYFSNVQNKSRTLTDLRQNNLLEAAVSFRVQGISWNVQNLVAANRRAISLIMEHSGLTLRIGEKVYYEGNGTYYAGRIKATEAAAGAVDADYVVQQYGRAVTQGVVLGAEHFIDIPPLQSFRVDWVVDGMTAGEQTASTPAAASKLRFILALHGLLRRPVQ